MLRRSCVGILGFFAFVGLVRGQATADPPVWLVEWGPTAILAPHSGPGKEHFELTASVAWREGMSGAYGIRVALPDGQVETQSLRADEGPGGRHLTAYIPAAGVRNIRPSALAVRVSVVDMATGAAVSNVLTAKSENFPRPRPKGTEIDLGPFGWGEPLDGSSTEARLLPRPGPDNFQFARIPKGDTTDGFFIATSEASNLEVARRLPGYDARGARSDDFVLEEPAQPAVGLTPAKAQEYLAALTKADPAGITYRLPTATEWETAARAGQKTAFWWGAEAKHPAGANFVGPEPALANEATAIAHPIGDGPRFDANPWGLFHTFGNVAEWATGPAGSFLRMGGHFRSEPESPLPQVKVEKDDELGPDAYVGVRPAFSIDAKTGAELIRKALLSDPRFASVRVQYNPDRASAELSGTLLDSSLRRKADRKLSALWFVTEVRNRIETPVFSSGQLAQLGGIAGPIKRITPMGRWVYKVPVQVRWGDPLPVKGSEWWVNIYTPKGTHLAHRLVELEPDSSRVVTVLMDRSKMAAEGLAVDAPVVVALSLQGPAPAWNGANVVSNLVRLNWHAP